MVLRLLRGCRRSARIAILMWLPPFTVDAPGAETVMIRVVPCKVTVLDQTSADVTTREMDGFVLAHGGFCDVNCV